MNMFHPELDRVEALTPVRRNTADLTNRSSMKEVRLGSLFRNSQGRPVLSGRSRASLTRSASSARLRSVISVEMPISEWVYRRVTFDGAARRYPTGRSDQGSECGIRHCLRSWSAPSPPRLLNQRRSSGRTRPRNLSSSRLPPPRNGTLSSLLREPESPGAQIEAPQTGRRCIAARLRRASLSRRTWSRASEPAHWQYLRQELQALHQLVRPVALASVV